MKKKVVAAMLLVLALVFASYSTVIPAFAKPDNAGPPDIQQVIFIHFAKGNPAKPPSGGTGYYNLIGAKWQSLPVSLEVNPSGLDEAFVLAAIGTAAEEWDDGDYSGLGGVTTNLFADTVAITTKGYANLAWTSGGLDGCNTIVWGNYPTEGVIAVTILWYNRLTKAILEFDIVLDTDYAWGDATTAYVMDLQNIATHELGHGAGLGDLYQSPAYRETMYGYASYGEIIKRDLYKGDIAGIQKLYA